jgi:hypothetical protein
MHLLRHHDQHVSSLLQLPFPLQSPSPQLPLVPNQAPAINKAPQNKHLNAMQRRKTLSVPGVGVGVGVAGRGLYFKWLALLQDGNLDVFGASLDDFKKGFDGEFDRFITRHVILVIPLKKLPHRLWTPPNRIRFPTSITTAHKQWQSGGFGGYQAE